MFEEDREYIDSFIPNFLSMKSKKRSQPGNVGSSVERSNKRIEDNWRSIHSIELCD